MSIVHIIIACHIATMVGVKCKQNRYGYYLLPKDHLAVKFDSVTSHNC